MLQSFSNREKFLALSATILLLATVFSAVSLVDANSKISELNSEVDNVTHQKNDLESMTEDLSDRNTRLQNNITSLEQDLETFRDYRITEIKDEAKEALTAEEWREFQTLSIEMNNSMQTAVDMSEYASNFVDAGTWREAGASYYIGRDYAQNAKNDLIDMRSLLDDEERREQLETIVDGAEEMETLFETMGDYSYAVYRGDQEEISTLEPQVEGNLDQLDQTGLDIELMGELFEDNSN